MKRHPSLVFRRRKTSGDSARSSAPPPPRTHIFMYCVYMYVVVHLCCGGQRNRERSLFSPSTTCVLGNKPCLVASAFIYQNTLPALSFILSLPCAAVCIMRFAFNKSISSDSTVWQMCLGISLLGKISSDKGSHTGIRLEIFPQRLPTVLFCYPRGLVST